ncbi:hypothetical protein C8R45DRAFT_1219005 [Mycena sanguinolenta]|nr:hypothetical protein C8R45DRAFT_1219005 [Mycena sanguinolenta]
MAAGFSFPPDLEREIFETAAISYPGFIPTLLRVCHRVQLWIEPLLYRVLVICSTWDRDHVLPVVTSKAAVFLQNSVQHLLLEDSFFGAVPSDTMDTYKRLLESCLGIVNLSIHLNLDPSIIFCLNQLRLRKLTLTVPARHSTWDLASFKHPFLLSVTHLCLFGDPSQLSTAGPNDLCKIASLPALTHLALLRGLADDFLSQIAADCPRLVLIVVVTFSRDAAVLFAENLAVADTRVVVTELGPRYPEDWKLGAWGGDDFWARAAVFLAQRRAGQAQGYLLDETAPSRRRSLFSLRVMHDVFE